ncbi:MAG TPA: NnrS family protein [Ideonella sp.]|nr:NnrS family protein [Ideonella sp.]
MTNIHLPVPGRHAPAPTPAPSGWPLLRLGFRPFYLGAAVSAVLLMLLWQGMLSGVLLPATGLSPVLWHAHEMLFGFVIAVIVGFLFTAGQLWTGLPTPRGAQLGALALLWAAARFAALLAPYPVFFFLDVLFLPLVAATFVDLLVRSGNRRNAGVGALLVLLALANLVFHLGASGALALDPLRALYAALAGVLVLESLIGGRVIPAFTRSVTPGAVLRESPALDRAAIAAMALGLALWVAGVAAGASAALLALAALLHAVRLAGWSPWLSRRRPVLWILHASYAWIPLGLALLAAAQAGVLPASAGVHALAVGATGGLIIGMLTRTARGHTGRPVQASRVEVAAYGLVMAAAALRVGATLFPKAYMALLGAAGLAWTLAFALYLLRFAPWLLAPRADGRDG